MLDKISDEELTYSKLSYLTPYSKVAEIAEEHKTIEDLRKYLIKSFENV